MHEQDKATVYQELYESQHSFGNMQSWLGLCNMLAHRRKKSEGIFFFKFWNRLISILRLI